MASKHHGRKEFSTTAAETRRAKAGEYRFRFENLLAAAVAAVVIKRPKKRKSPYKRYP
jgi:hypothetical protein